MIKRILVTLSGTTYTATAIKHAVALAKREQAVLCGFTIVDLDRLEDVGPVPIGGGAAAKALRESRVDTTEKMIEQCIVDFEDSAREAGITTCVLREFGNSVDRLIADSRYQDFIVMGLRGLFEYGVISNPHDQILKLIAVGVRPILAVAEQPRQINRVLIAYNGSIEAAKTMKTFVRMNPYPDTTVEITCIGKAHESDVEAMLGDAASYCRAYGFEVTTSHPSGDPHHDLLKHAEQSGADLLVMGATSRSRLAKFIWGDTALNVLENAQIPVLFGQ